VKDHAVFEGSRVSQVINAAPTVVSGNYKPKNLDQEFTKDLSEKYIWCQVRDYQDLSQHQSILSFNRWLKDFKDIACLSPANCQEHDPRVVTSLLQAGKILARARKETFAKIIRADPKTAIELAIPQETIALLPKAIVQELEIWESAIVDIDAIHFCFDPNHPRGTIKRIAHFDDGRSLRTWSFGKRRKLPTTKGIAVWGISIGEDFAISENPFRMVEETSEVGLFEFAGKTISYDGLLQKKYAARQLSGIRRRTGQVTRIQYPLIMASGSTVDDMLATKYEINSSKVTFQQALAAAMEKNATLLSIDSAEENKLVTDMLLKAFAQNDLFLGLNEANESVSYLWLGATDNNETNGTRFDKDLNVSVQDVNISATEGNWRWLNAESSNPPEYENWKWGVAPSNAPSNATKDFAAIDWNATGGTWLDINETARLPFIIEHDLELATQQTDLRGIRKVLVVPARFVDETTAFKSALGGSNTLLANDLSENILEEIINDPYEPISREKIEEAIWCLSLHQQLPCLFLHPDFQIITL